MQHEMNQGRKYNQTWTYRSRTMNFPPSVQSTPTGPDRPPSALEAPAVSAADPPTYPGGENSSDPGKSPGKSSKSG
jgi:hypothetical protein